MSKVTVAATQMHCDWDREGNVDRAEKLVRKAASQGAQIILIQELFETPYFCIEQNFKHYDLATTLEENTSIRRMAGLAKKQRPKLLSDNGPCYISAELQDWLKHHGLSHTRGKPYHPMTQGKIERWHRSLKNRILLEHYYLPGELERQINEFVNHYNERRYHESLNNLTPQDVWLGRGRSILDHRRKIKEETLQLRKQLYFERKTA